MNRHLEGKLGSPSYYKLFTVYKLLQKIQYGARLLDIMTSEQKLGELRYTPVTLIWTPSHGNWYMTNEAADLAAKEATKAESWIKN
jgi:hypothetical protein